MRNPEETIGKLIDKATVTIISYCDDEGYPISKAMLILEKELGLRNFI